MPRARGCGAAFWTAPGLASLHCISARFQLVFSCHVFYPLVFIGYYHIFYCHIVKRLCRPLFVGGAIQIHID